MKKKLSIEPPPIFYSASPPVLLIVEEDPVLPLIEKNDMQFAVNTNCDFFFDKKDTTQNDYILLSGRWFRAGELSGSWSFAGPDLPADFGKIPPK